MAANRFRLVIGPKRIPRRLPRKNAKRPARENACDARIKKCFEAMPYPGKSPKSEALWGREERRSGRGFTQARKRAV